ncbi:hypothetical protein Tco_0282530 [Tanacetum coccineum]
MGVTNKLIKKVNGSETSYMVPGELMESVRTHIDAELNRLVEMRKQIKDDHEQKKLEIAEEHKRNKAEPEDMSKKIEDQRDKLVKDAVKKLIQKLPPRVKNEDLNKEPPSLTKIFERTRERKEGHVYADTYDETERLIEQMKNYNATKEGESGEDGGASVDPFLAVMNKEYNGHRRLFGRGVTNKLIKKVNGSETSYMVPGELIESMRTDIYSELNRLVEIRKQIEDDHEQKKLEIAEEHKRNKAQREDMSKKIEDQRDKLVEDAVKKLIQKLPPRVVREFLT